MHACVSVPGGLYLTVVCVSIATSLCTCPLRSSQRHSCLPTHPVSALFLWRCGYLLPTLWVSVLSPSLCRPAPSLCVCVSVYTVPPPHPLHSASLEENIQTLQHQHPKFILQQLWPGGTAKEKSGRGEEERVPESGRHEVGRGEQEGGGVPSRTGAMHLAGEH